MAISYRRQLWTDSDQGTHKGCPYKGICLPIMAPYRRCARQSLVPHRGQATIELAIVALFILVPLLIGIADITRAYFEHLAVVDAANVGARWTTLSSTQQ